MKQNMRLEEIWRKDKEKEKILENAEKFIEKNATLVDVTVHYKWHGTYITFWILEDDEEFVGRLQRQLDKRFGKYWNADPSPNRIKITVETDIIKMKKESESNVEGN